MAAQAAAPRLALVAGEASGDLLGGLLLGALKARWPALTAYGIGGPKMGAQGFSAWWPHEKLAVRGYVEVLRHYREIVGIRRSLGDRLLADRPDLFIGVDAPDFNLDLEKRLRAAGVRTVHFISPSIWAWRAGRIETVRQAADEVLCVFPFEPAIYERAGIAATYVGHPLADAIPLVPPREASRAALGLSPDDRVVALLPGSRRSEVQQHGVLFVRAAARALEQDARLRFVLPAAPGLKPALQAAVQGEPRVGSRLLLTDGGSHTALAACDASLVASGTATLEAALFKRPMVIVYRMNPISWQLMKRQRLQPWVGLPNILLGRFAVPERLQAEATPERLAKDLLQTLEDAPGRAALEAEFTGLHRILRQDMAQRAGAAIERLLQTTPALAPAAGAPSRSTASG